MIRALLADRKSVTRRLSKQWLKVKAGDRLWCKETHWRLGAWIKNGKTKTGRQRWTFHATKGEFVRFVSPEVPPTRHEHGWHKRPSIFMPRWASRILLECEEDARAEPLWNITESECVREGFPIPEQIVNFGMSANRHFEYYWRDLHTKDGEQWESNPTIIRVGAFRRIA